MRTVEIDCPKCRQRTPIAVATVNGGEGGQSGTSTACRRCGARFTTITQQDGRIVILDEENVAALQANRPIAPLVIMPDAAPGTSHQVLPPTRFGIFERSGDAPARPRGASDDELASDITSTEQILWRPDGTRRTPQEASKFVGWRGVWVAQLNEALRDRLAGPPPLTYPPGIFLSYRWGTPSQNNWVEELGTELMRRGYPTTLDRTVPADEMIVPTFVSRIADCRYLLAILDPGYLERLGGEGQKESVKDGWVFDEVNTARFLEQHDRIRIIGLLREGTQLPAGFRQPVVGWTGNTIDVRTSGQLRQFLDDIFPPLQSPPDAAAVTTARAALAASHHCLAEGRLGEAFVHAAEATKLIPGTADGYAQQTRIAIAANDPASGLEAAQAALHLMPNSGELMLAAAHFAYHSGRPNEAIQYCSRLRTLARASDDEKAFGGYLIGTALDEVGQLHAARAHLAVARRRLPDTAELLNDLGFVCRKLGAPQEAIEYLAEGLRLVPDDRNLLTNLVAAAIEAGHSTLAAEALQRLGEHHCDHPDLPRLQHALDAVRAGVEQRLVPRIAEPPVNEGIVCSNCAGVIPLTAEDQTLCGGCGSRLSAAERNCPHCGSDGRIFPAFMRRGLACVCPYCGQGTLTIETGREWMKRSRSG